MNAVTMQIGYEGDTRWVPEAHGIFVDGKIYVKIEMAIYQVEYALTGRTFTCSWIFGAELPEYLNKEQMVDNKWKDGRWPLAA